MLDLANPVNAWVSGLADIGLTFPLFMAGFEMDFERVKGGPLSLEASAG